MVVLTAAARQWLQTLQHFGALADPADPDKARIRWLRGRMVEMPLGEHLALVVVPNMGWGTEAARLLVGKFGQRIGPVLLLKAHQQVWFFTGPLPPGTVWELPGLAGPVLHTSGTASMPSPTRDGETWMWLSEPRAGVLTPPTLVAGALKDVHRTLRRQGLA